MNDIRRHSPRIGIEAVCWEILDDTEATGITVDLSAHGLCLERPYAGGPTRKDVAMQIEIPGMDEVMWAKAEASFDVLIPTGSPGRGGPLGLVRRTGYRIITAARRDLRNLREFVVETHRQRSGVSSLFDVSDSAQFERLTPVS